MSAHIIFDEDGNEQTVAKPAPTLNKLTTPRGGKSGTSTEPATRVQKPDVRIWKHPNNKQRFNNGRGNSRPKKKSVKGQIRSIQRLLNGKGAELASGVRKAKERELEELIRLRDEHDRRELEKSMAKKYRMVKFFERRKLERVLQNIVEKGDRAEDADKKKEVLRDLRYVTEYPKDKKYISLFPSEGHTEESMKRVEEMRVEIEGKATALGAEGCADTKGDSPKDASLALSCDDFFMDNTSD